MLLAAFRLLGAMYEEVGYRRRDVPALVLANNLSGMEIDPRAAQLAELCLALEACSWDRNFLADPTDVDVTVLRSVKIDPVELPKDCALAKDWELLDALSNFSLCGSLLEPAARDLSDLRAAIASLPGGLGDSGLRRRLEDSLASCLALSRRFSVVVTNPPYMGSKNMAPWLNRWVSERFPDAKRDLCTCFIERCRSMAKQNGYSALVTMHSWMFISSYESFRHRMLEESPIISMAHLGTRAFGAIAGEVVQTTAFVSQHGDGKVVGNYIRLVDFPGEAEKEVALKEAVVDVACGWVYHRANTDFEDIPGNPIAYWASDAVRRAFREGNSIGLVSDFTGSQNITGNNAKYLRYWWEISYKEFGKDRKWITYYKGGEFRRWYGNTDVCVDIDSNALQFYRDNKTSNCLSRQYWYRKGITYNAITSGKRHFRYALDPGLFDKGGPVICERKENLSFYLGMLNSSIADTFFSFLCPTLNTQVQDIMKVPFFDENETDVVNLVRDCISLSQFDWITYETSRDFASSPLIPDKEV